MMVSRCNRGLLKEMLGLFIDLSCCRSVINELLSHDTDRFVNESGNFSDDFLQSRRWGGNPSEINFQAGEAPSGSNPPVSHAEQRSRLHKLSQPVHRAVFPEIYDERR